MKIEGMTNIKTQALVDMALEIDHLKRQAEEMAMKLKAVQKLIDDAEDEDFEKIEAGTYIAYPHFILIEDVAKILDIDFESRADRWKKAAISKQKILKANLGEENA